MSARILIVDDDKSIRRSLYDRLVSWGYRTAEAESCTQAREILRQQELNLILLDLQLPDGDGLTMLEEIVQADDTMAVIMITAHGSIQKAVEAMQRGASDFLQKPVDYLDLRTRIKKALHHSQLKRDIDSIQAGRIEELRRHQAVAVSERMKECLKECARLSQSDTTVLILGETGTGKEVLARLIHANSPRANRPFVAIGCANFTEELINDELFGHDAGAYTGATKARRGKVELADGGTLFLDELGELPFGLQAKLLRFLEERKYCRIGSNFEREADARVIAATNRDLGAEIRQKRFREDLYFRLNVYSISIPPLRERREDIPPLVDHFLTQMGGRQSRRLVIAPEALQMLMRYHWPGNVRELRNVLERSTILADDGMITPEHLPKLDPLNQPCGMGSGTYNEQVAAFERGLLLQTLDEFGGNRTKAADKLGLYRTELNRKLERYGFKDYPRNHRRQEDYTENE